MAHGTILEMLMENAEDCEGEIVAFKVMHGSGVDDYHTLTSIKAYITGLIIPEGSKVRRLQDLHTYNEPDGWKAYGEETDDSIESF